MGSHLISPSGAFPVLLKQICRAQHLIELSGQTQRDARAGFQTLSHNIVSRAILSSAHQESGTRRGLSFEDGFVPAPIVLPHVCCLGLDLATGKQLFGRMMSSSTTQGPSLATWQGQILERSTTGFVDGQLWRFLNLSPRRLSGR